MWVLFVVSVIILIILFIRRNTEETSIKTYPKRLANIDFFWNGKQLYKKFFNDIQEAKHYVCVSFFIVRSDQFSEKFFKLLANTSNRGVSVYLLVDRLGSFSIKNKDLRNLKKSGVHITFSNKFDVKQPLRSINQRNHRKISIVDGRVSYIGGFNIGDEYINDDSKFSLWRDYHIRATGEVVEDILDVFCNDWERNKQEKLELAPIINNKGQTLCQVVPSANGTLQKTFINLIEKAEKTIGIGTPYFIPSDELMNILEKKAKNQVKISILYPHQSDHPLVKEASMPFLVRMEKAGAEVKLFTKGFYHAKAIFIDDKVCDIGTANFDHRSLFINEEVNLMIYDEPTIKDIYKFYKEDFDDSMSLYDQWLKHPRPYLMAVKKFLAKLIHPLL